MKQVRWYGIAVLALAVLLPCVAIAQSDRSVAVIGGADANVDEGSTVNFPIEFQGTPRTAFSTVSFSITGTATSADYMVAPSGSGSDASFDPSAATGSIDIHNEQSSVSIPITIVRDAFADAGETIIVTLTGHTGGGVASDVSSAPRTYTITEPPPDFGGQTVDDMTYTIGTPISLTLPEATGSGSVSYSLLPMENYNGLSFSPSSRILSGSLTSVGTNELTYTATDSSSSVAALTFSVTGQDDRSVAVIGGADANVDEGSTVNFPIEFQGMPRSAFSTVSFSVTGTATSGADYMVAPPGSSDARFDASTGTGSIDIGNEQTSVSIPITIVRDAFADAGETIIVTLTGHTGGGVASDVSSAPRTYTITEPPPDFGGQTVDDMTYTIGTPISLTLPEATGSGSVSYSLLPMENYNGLSFSPSSRILSGSLTSVGTNELTYTATDSSSRVAALTFSVTGQVDGNEAVLGGADMTVFEGSTVNFPIEFRGTPRSAVSTVSFSVTGTASSADYTVGSGSDASFDASAGTGSIDIGTEQTSVSIPIAIVSDSNPDPGETIIVMLTGHTSRGTDATVASSAPRTYTIAEPPPDFGGQTVDDLTYTVSQVITTALTLPDATGRGSVSYTLLPASGRFGFSLGSIDGSSPLVLAGTPSAVGSTVMTYTATDSHGGSAALTFRLTVEPAPGAETAPAFADGVEPPAQTYTFGDAISALTLPAAAGGDGTLFYALTPVPGGLAFDADTRIVSGTPTSVGAVTLTYTVSDSDTNTAASDTDTLTFRVTVPGTAPAFADGVALPDQVYTVGIPTGELTLPEATGGDGRLNYTIAPNLATAVPGLILNPSTLVLSGTPTMVVGAVVLTYTARDSDTDTADSDTDTLTFRVTVQAASDTAPAFADGVAPPGQTYTVGAAITALTLPEAAAGNGVLTYALTPAGALPAGLTFDANTRIVSGTPTSVMGAVVLTYTASDSDTNTGASDTDTLTFSVTVQAAPVSVTPAVTISPTVLTVAEGANAAYTVVLTTNPGGMVTITPGIAPDSHDLTLTPGGALTFTAANWNTAQTVTVAAAQDTDSVDDAATITHAVTGYGSVIADPVTVTVTDTDSAPDFGAARVENQRYNVDTPITTLTLPTASGGDGALSYTLTGNFPAGLTFATDTLTLFGTPTVTATTQLTWTATDADSQQTSLTFTLTVVASDPPGVTLSATALTVTEGATGAYTVVLDSNPAGDVTVTPASGDSAVATVTGALTFTAATWNTAQTVTVTAAGDSDDVDDTTTITHAVTGYGSVTADPVTVTVTDSAPDFGAANVAAQRYTVGAAVSLTLPAASGGGGTLSYALTGNIPAGLTYTNADRTLSGTPTVTATTQLTWTAMDADSQTSRTFTLTVVASDTGKAQRAALNRVIMPEVARALADQGVSAIARRIRQAGADSVDAGQTLTLGGQSTLAGALTTHGRALAEGAFDLKTLLGGSDFVLPLNAREVAPGLSAITLWGGGDYRALSGKGDAINWDGDMFSAQLGADARLRDDLLAGVAVSWSEADLDYTGSGNGDYEVGLTSVHPYVGWTAMGGRLDLWATVGYGWGELEITDDDLDPRQATSDVTMQTIGAGGSAQVLESRVATLRVKGEALQTSMDVEGSGSIAAVVLEARRLRLGLEASRTHQLAGGGQLMPTLEVGMRHDAGDGRTGTGAELGGGLRYTSAANWLTVESHGRVLVGHSGDYQDWGIGGAVRLAAGQDGHGLSFSLQPAWGATASRVSQVWAQGAAAPASAVSRPRDGRVDMNLGYGLGWEEMLVTPYSQVTLTNGPVRAYRLGSRMRLDDRLLLNLEGTRQETAAQPVDHGVLLKIELNF